MRIRDLGQKQTEDNSYWVSLWHSIEYVISRDHIHELAERTAAEIRAMMKGQRVAYAWSGGKDSQALRGVCEMAGIQDCMLGMSNLEYPEFLRWVTDHMPWELEVVNTKQDIQWLQQHPEMLFPQDSAIAGKWFKIIQHTAQERYYKKHQLDAIILGRRRQDGNFVGRDGANIYTNARGFTRYSPICDWTHEEVMAFCKYYGYDLAPCYRWPNGWVVGTGSWPARQWTGSIQNGWKEVWMIDQDIVRWAADYMPSAQTFLANREAKAALLEGAR